MKARIPRLCGPATIAVALVAFAALPALADKTLDLSGLPASVASNVRAVLQQANALNALSQVTSRGVPSGSDTPALGVPILEGSARAQVSASKEITVAWVGGRPAYKAQLLSSADKPVASVSGTDTQAVFKSEAIVPGSYSVEITDSTGKTAKGTFDVVQPEPALVPDSIDQYSGSIPPPVFGIAKASLYAKQGRQYYLQAYQLVSPFTDYPEAVNLREVLVQGAPVH
jgi:hypothetical protein